MLLSWEVSENEWSENMYDLSQPNELFILILEFGVLSLILLYVFGTDTNNSLETVFKVFCILVALILMMWMILEAKSPW